jgi:hypothetical protein
MESQKDTSNQNESNETGKVVELPIIEFIGINFITAMVPFYICLGIFFLIYYILIEIISIPLIIHLFIFPIFIFFLYHIYILILIEVCALWVYIWNKKSPPQQGMFKRVLHDVHSPEGKMLKYYHRRGFIIKFPIWLSSKSPFPWLLNRTLRRIGHNELGKNVIYCNAFPGLELTELGDNSFIYPASILSSHAVQSIFGKITIKKVKLGRETVFYPGCVAGPGAKTEDDVTIYPCSGLPKNWKGEKNQKYYTGIPARPIDKNEIRNAK